MRKAKRKIDKFIKIRHTKSESDIGRGASSGETYMLESDFNKACIDIETDDLKNMSRGAYWIDEGPKNRMVMSQVNSMEKLERARGTKLPQILDLFEPMRYIKSIEIESKEAFPDITFHPSNEKAEIPPIFEIIRTVHKSI